MYEYTVLTYYVGDGPKESFVIHRQNPIHLGEQIGIKPPGWKETIELDIFDVMHDYDRTLLFCNVETYGLDEDGVNEFHAYMATGGEKAR